MNNIYLYSGGKYDEITDIMIDSLRHLPNLDRVQDGIHPYMLRYRQWVAYLFSSSSKKFHQELAIVMASRPTGLVAAMDLDTKELFETNTGIKIPGMTIPWLRELQSKFDKLKK